jgi:hypothetical protein
MKRILILIVGIFSCLNAFGGGHDPKAIAILLKDAKISLVDGIDQAERSSGPATSAKFEIGDDGKLVLSVYTIPEGLAVEPEKATLTELSGDPTISPFVSVGHVFADKEHIARASVHMTLFQLSKMSLKQVIRKALHRIPGSALDVRNPVVRNRRPVADVIINGLDKEFYVVTVDLLNGRTRVKELE